MTDDEIGVGDLASLAELHESDPAAADDLSTAQDAERQHLRNADSLTAAIDRRLGDADSLHRASVKKKDAIKDRLETVEEMKDDEAVYEQYIRQDPDAREYVDNLLQLIALYQEQIDQLVPETMLLYPTVEQLKDMVDEQQLRHDESFVLEHTKTVVQEMKESFQDTTQSLRQSHEATNEELLNRFDRMLQRYSQVSGNQVKLQQSMTEMVALMEEFAGSIDTTRTKRIEEKLERIETEIQAGEREA